MQPMNVWTSDTGSEFRVREQIRKAKYSKTIRRRKIKSTKRGGSIKEQKPQSQQP